MRTIILFFLTSLIYNTSLAQDPQLFENDWYLSKLNIDGMEYPAPQNDEIDFIQLVIVGELFTSEICDELFQGDEVTISNTEINISNFIVTGFNDCTIPENVNYTDLYLSQFFNTQLSNRIFSYIIESNGTDLALTLTNEEGYKAFYGNTPLSVNGYDVSRFAIFPNPLKDILNIISTELMENINIKIYSTEGKLLKVENFNLENQTSIDVLNLSSGIYFLNIEDERGNTTIKKFVKE